MAKQKDSPAKKQKRPPFTSYADAVKTAEAEGYRIVEEIRTFGGGLRLNVVRGARPETWRVNA